MNQLKNYNANFCRHLLITSKYIISEENSSFLFCESRPFFHPKNSTIQSKLQWKLCQLRFLNLAPLIFKSTQAFLIFVLGGSFEFKKWRLNKVAYTITIKHPKLRVCLYRHPQLKVTKSTWTRQENLESGTPKLLKFLGHTKPVVTLQNKILCTSDSVRLFV